NEGRVIAALARGFELGRDIACESGFERHMRIPAWLDGMAARVGALLHAGRRRADELPTWKPGLFRFILSDHAIGRRLWTSSKEPRPAPVRQNEPGDFVPPLHDSLPSRMPREWPNKGTRP